MACMQTLNSSHRLCVREKLNKNIFILLIKNVATYHRGQHWVGTSS